VNYNIASLHINQCTIFHICRSFKHLTRSNFINYVTDEDNLTTMRSYITGGQNYIFAHK
jgi:hypothetical protein